MSYSPTSATHLRWDRRWRRRPEHTFHTRRNPYFPKKKMLRPCSGSIYNLKQSTRIKIKAHMINATDRFRRLALGETRSRSEVAYGMVGQEPRQSMLGSSVADPRHTQKGKSFAHRRDTGPTNDRSIRICTRSAHHLLGIHSHPFRILFHNGLAPVPQKVFFGRAFSFWHHLVSVLVFLRLPVCSHLASF